MKIAALARQARESLGQGLQALQEGDAPERLLAVAEHLAKAMGTLVEMETAPPASARKATEVVLAALRDGLEQLQLPGNVELAAAQTALSSVAEALNCVHQISASDDGEPRAALGKTQVAGAAPAPAATAAIPAAPAPKAAAPAAAAPKAAAPAAPAPKAAAAAPAAAPVAKVEAAPDASPPPSSISKPMRAIEAALGAHSATNFYKGLSGGDIVASGGLFVATYQAPALGEPLLLKVTMPGGYAFEAKGVVAWRRDVETSSHSHGETPGFGAQFSEISDEGRGLIQRYVRNREPLFHDDA
ncbi:MAG: hypothetical protein RL685_5690 [Pseudomonadota bacterium]